MVAALFLLAGGGLLVLAVHPFTTFPASLWLLARARPRPIASRATTGRAALCVCAYNEERVIRAKIENMLAMDAGAARLDVLVYVDGSDDRTAEIAREFGDRITLVASGARLGKTHGMNTLVAMTDADFVVFSDANVEFAPDAVTRLLEPFGDPAVGCVCGHLMYTAAAGNTTAVTGSLYWRLEETIKTYESATGSVMGADGSIFALRRALHTPPPPDLIDDMFVSLAILCDGYRIVRMDTAHAFEAAVWRPREEFRRKVRIACQAFNVHRALWPRLRRLPLLDRYKYLSHKLLRWLAIFLLAGGALSLAAGLALGSHWRVLAALAAVAAFGLTRRTLRDVLAAFVATGIGVLRSIRGERFQTWTPPSSARTLTPAVPTGSD